MLESASSN
jgi:hypothetical protein